MASWITLTDSQGVDVRINIDAVAYYRSDGALGTVLAFASPGKDRMLLSVRQSPNAVDIAIQNGLKGKGGFVYGG